MTLETIRQTFTDWAPHYDATHSWSLPNRREARLALGVQPGDRVLDIACGTGANFKHLSELVGEAGRVTGVDLTPAMLNIARAKIVRHGWENVEVHTADAAQLPFPAASFDRAICAFAMNIIPDYAEAIVEAWRVLVPGGRLVVLDLNLPDNRFARRLSRFARTCAVELGHDSITELRRTFADVEVRWRWVGLIYIAVAVKG